MDLWYTSRINRYSSAAADAEAEAQATGAWVRPEGGREVREVENDVDAPLLAVDYYGRLTKSAALKERHVSMSVKFGLPLPDTHLKYLKEKEEGEKRRAAIGVGGGGASSLSLDSSHSLFLGGESLWSETSGGITRAEEGTVATIKLSSPLFSLLSFLLLCSSPFSVLPSLFHCLST